MIFICYLVDFYVRAFIKEYARAVDLNPEVVTRSFDED